MSDLISRKEAIEWCLEGLNNMPSAQPHWIPCSERLPEEGQEVLASTKDFIYIAEIEENFEGRMLWNETTEYRVINGVLAWMPLPKPYGGESE